MPPQTVGARASADPVARVPAPACHALKPRLLRDDGAVMAHANGPSCPDPTADAGLKDVKQGWQQPPGHGKTEPWTAHQDFT